MFFSKGKLLWERSGVFQPFILGSGSVGQSLPTTRWKSLLAPAMRMIYSSAINEILVTYKFTVKHFKRAEVLWLLGCLQWPSVLWKSQRDKWEKEADEAVQLPRTSRRLRGTRPWQRLSQTISTQRVWELMAALVCMDVLRSQWSRRSCIIIWHFW